MTMLYVIYKDGELFRTRTGQYAYLRKRQARKVITEQIKADPELVGRFEVVSYEPRR